MRYLLIFVLFVYSAICACAQNSYEACGFGSGDIGARINAADSSAGSAPADIWVTCSGTVSTMPAIHSYHRLILAAPITWDINLSLSSNTQVLGTGQEATQALQPVNSSGQPIPWIIATGLANVSISNLSATVNMNGPLITGTSLTNVDISKSSIANSYSGAGAAATILHCLACNGIAMTNNHILGMGLLETDTTASSYSAVTASNITDHVILSDNFVDGQGNQVVLAYLMYVNDVVASNNTAYNAQYNVEWWGGNAAVEGLTPSNPRWASDINITGGIAYNVRAGFWGSMGQDVTVSGVTVDTCQDVGLDAESSSRAVFSGFTVHNCANGGLAAFYSSQQVEFGPGTVTSDTAANSLLWAHNSSANPASAVGVKVHNVKFVCSDSATLCNLNADPIGGFQFDDNEIVNGTLLLTGNNNSGYDISRNNFTFTYTPSSNFSAITVPGQVYNYLPTSTIASNTVHSTTLQNSETYAINAAITDYNYSDILYVRNNVTSGFTNEAKFVANSGNGGITPTFIFVENNWGNNSLSNVVSGNLGSFRTSYVGTPANSSASCIQGQIESDASYLYTCVATNTWRRVATSVF